MNYKLKKEEVTLKNKKSDSRKQKIIQYNLFIIINLI